MLLCAKVGHKLCQNGWVCAKYLMFLRRQALKDINIKVSVRPARRNITPY